MFLSQFDCSKKFAKMLYSLQGCDLKVNQLHQDNGCQWHLSSFRNVVVTLNSTLMSQKTSSRKMGRANSYHEISRETQISIVTTINTLNTIIVSRRSIFFRNVLKILLDEQICKENLLFRICLFGTFWQTHMCFNSSHKLHRYYFFGCSSR
jgi:hypothetical protein